MNPADPAGAIAHLAPKLRPILRRARELGAFINFDMESYAHKNTTLELFKTIFTEEEFKNWAHAGIVIQAYLRDSESDLRDLIEWGRKRGTRFAVRLVKGAYWDYETTKSLQNGWDCPVYFQKPESDANFETLTRLLLKNESIVTAAFGSHNIRSIAHAQAFADELGLDPSRFEFQLLYGMAGPIKRALVEMGYRVREYCPVGELLPGMAYLVRPADALGESKRSGRDCGLRVGSRDSRGRARCQSRARGIWQVEPDAIRRTGAFAGARGGHPGTQALRTIRGRSLRGRQTVE